KWTYFYLGALYTEFGVSFHKDNPGRKNDYLTRAWKSYDEVLKLKGTRSTYLLMANLIKEHGYIIPGKTKEESNKYADELLGKADVQPALAQPKQSIIKKNHPEPISILERFAKPMDVRNARKNVLRMKPEEAPLANNSAELSSPNASPLSSSPKSAGSSSFEP